MKDDCIVVLDFGGQYSHLIARRVRESGVYSELVPHNIEPSELIEIAPKGLILSGSPSSVYEEKAPKCDPEIFQLGMPILGICYGLHLISHLLGGKVERAEKKEFGRSELQILDKSELFKGLGDKITVWMSHGDYVRELPPGFEATAVSPNSPFAAIKDPTRKIYGVQFHPEVVHTEQGKDIVRNFALSVCGCKPTWNMSSFIRDTIEDVRRDVAEDEKVICAVSGGVDSTATAVLIHKAIGDRLSCIFVDHGLLRKNETFQVLQTFRDLGIDLRLVDASERFLQALKEVKDPEEKRRIVGEEFIKVFSEEGAKLGAFQWLAQGTLYPDVIESAKTGSPASRIKTHHNVAGLPSWMTFKLLEPLRQLYKDEVREVASLLGVANEICNRHPFPGPGLAVRIVGEVTTEKIRICRDSGHIVEEELRKGGIYDSLWQAFAIVGDDMAVGVLGDERKYGRIVTIRIVESVDAMTADWYRIPYDTLEKISNKITNEVTGVTWVTYAVSSKPPSTIEPC